MNRSALDVLEELEADRPKVGLDDFVEIANRVLPDVIPDNPANTRVKPTVNARLVRHHVAEGNIDETVREGREAFYGYDHLLQLLVVRRLLADGIAASAIGELARGKSRDALRSILERGFQLAIAPPANPAQDAITQIRRRAGAQAAPDPVPRPDPRPSHWHRIPLADGVELHVRSDTTDLDDDRLAEALRRELARLAQRKERP